MQPTRTNCGWCASKIETETPEKMHDHPLCEDCSNLVQGGQARTAEELMEGAKIAAFIWFCLFVLVIVFGVWAGLSV